MERIRQQRKHCLEKIRAGQLREADLQQALETLLRHDKRAISQRLLYLQAASTAITTQVCGMSLFDAEGQHDGPDDPDDWPYQTVLEAMLDGWRIIKFPETALIMAGEEEAYGLGCEFILEK